MTTPTYQPVDPAHLVEAIGELLAAAWVSHPLRVAIDGPRCAAPVAFAQSVVVPLQTRGRAARVIDAETFWRDASLRFEYGHTDLASYTQGWLDVDALRREVLYPLGRRTSARYLPALRDPDSNRSLRVPSQHADERAVIMVAGELLLGRQLTFRPDDPPSRWIRPHGGSGARRRSGNGRFRRMPPIAGTYSPRGSRTSSCAGTTRGIQPSGSAVALGIRPDSQQSMR